MAARYFLLVCIFLLGGCAFEIDDAMDRDAATGELTAVWVKRDEASKLGATELLALQVVKNSGKPQSSGTMSARLMQDDPPFAIVVVEERAVKDDVTIKTLYRFREEEIIEQTSPEYLQGADPSDNRPIREQYAREVAMQAKNRTLPLMPVMYESKYAYSPQYDGSCKVVVTEKNAKYKVTGTFIINVCVDEKK